MCAPRIPRHRPPNSTPQNDQKTRIPIDGPYTLTFDSKARIVVLSKLKASATSEIA
jgi:hypothetical protein